MSVSGVGFKSDVTLEGIPTCLPSSSSDDPLKNSTQVPYQLEFGSCSVNSLVKRCFRIVNHSGTDTFKFQFASFDRFMFAPSVGHLKPFSSKDIISTFQSRVPVKVFQVSFEETRVYVITIKIIK